MNGPLDDLTPELIAAIAEYEASIPTTRVPCGGMLFTYTSIEDQKRVAEIIKGTHLARTMEKRGWHPTFMIFGAEYDGGKRAVEQVGNAKEFLRQVDQYERLHKTPEQHARLHLLKVKVRVDCRAADFRRNWKDQGRTIDHAAVKEYFDRVLGDGSLERKAYGEALFNVHSENPLRQFIFGRAMWTYISLEVAAKIDAILSAEGRKTTDDQCWTSSKVNYVAELGEELRYLPPMSLDRHRTFLDWFEEEWAFATDEQREIGRRMLTQMEADGVEIHATLKDLANKE